MQGRKFINNGVDKLNKELDIISILESVRKLELIIQMIMTEKQITLSRFRKSTTIMLNSNKEVSSWKFSHKPDVEEDHNFVQFPFYDAKSDIVRKHYQNVNTLVGDLWTDKLTENDVFLIGK